MTLCSEFLNGGTDTTATGIEWGIAELILNPHVQSKLYEEIKSTVGDKRVDEKDVENMPYLQATVKELLRKHPPTYFVLTHSVTEPTKLAGYDIPTDVNVEIFLPPIARDPSLWSDPEKFNPDRYEILFKGTKVSSMHRQNFNRAWGFLLVMLMYIHRFFTGKEDADITGVTGVKMLPFGVGRRICPGMGMATVHVHLMLARMVQEFEWSAYPPNSKIDFTEKLEFTVVMKNPLKALVKPRA